MEAWRRGTVRSDYARPDGEHRPAPAQSLSGSGLTGIDKRPADGPVAVAVPGPQGTGEVGLAGDRVYDVKHHGGPDQAVYAYAREELDMWAAELGISLDNGTFGENLTTAGLAVSDTLIGERWRVGPQVVLEAACTRIPCGTFQGWLGRRGWMKRFTEAARPGTYFRVITPGQIRSGDEIEVLFGRAKAAVFGLPAEPAERDRYRTEQQAAVRRAFAAYSPQAMVVFDVDFGHTDPQWVLPYGGAVTVDGPARTITAHYGAGLVSCSGAQALPR